MIRTKLAIIVFGLCFVLGFGQDKPKSILEEGIDYYRAGDYPKAITSLKEVIKKSIIPEELLQAFIYLGYTYFSLPDTANAKIQIERAIDTDPEYLPKESDGFSTEFIELYKSVKESIAGIVFFDSDPYPATIVLDGKVVGSTPMKKELLAKKYEMKFVKTGYEVWVETIEIKKGDIHNIKASLRDMRNWKTFLRSAAAMIVLGYIIKIL